MNITLEIFTPEKIFFKGTADKVILPVKEGNLTIIKDRAPRLQVLTKGKIVLLNPDNTAFRSWQIDGGVAEIAKDVCQIAVEKISE